MSCFNSFTVLKTIYSNDALLEECGFISENNKNRYRVNAIQFMFLLNFVIIPKKWYELKTLS